MARTFFRKLLTYISSEDDSDIELNDDLDGQSSSDEDNSYQCRNAIENEVRELDRPIAKKRKRKAQRMQVEEIIQLRKRELTLLKESHAQAKEFYRLKAEKMEHDKEKVKRKLHLEDERLRLEAEKLEHAKKKSDQRILMMDLSVMPKTQRQYYEELQREIMRKHNHV